MNTKEEQQQLQTENARKTAKEMVRQKNYEGAVAAYQEAITLNPKQPGWIFIELGECLEKIGKVDEAIEAYQNECKLHPTNPYGYVKLANVYYLKKSQWDQAIDNYLKAIKLRPGIPIGFYRRLVDALNQQGRQEEAKTWTNSIKQRLKEDKTYLPYLNIWQFLNQATQDEKIFDYSTEMNLAVVREYFELTSQVAVINLNNLKESDKQFLENAGFKLDFIKLNKVSSINRNGVLEEEFIKYQDFEIPVQPQEILAIQRKRATDFQQSIIRNRCVYVICPITGETLSSKVSFSIVKPKRMWVGCYRFVSKNGEVFYLISDSSSCQKYSLYFPRIECIVDLHDKSQATAFNIDALHDWKADWVTHWITIQNYIFKENQDKSIAAVIGISENIGHHLWNDLSGIMAAYEAGNLPKIDQLLVVGTEFFGRIDEIFPEIPAEKIKRIDTLKGEGGASQEILENNYFALRLANSFVKEELAQRIYQVCLKKCSLSTIAKIEEAKKKHFPLIWINIRTHNREWVSQIEGIANIIKQLASNYPNLGVVFDGVSLIGDEERGPTKPEIAMIKGASSVVEQIFPLLSKKNVGVYNIIGCMMHESIIWAHAIDFYIHPFTGGIAKVTLLANKPGILHTNKAYAQMPQWQVFGTGFERENGVLAVMVPDSFIVDIASESGTGGNSNYDLDWKVIYDAAVKIVSQLRRT